MKKLCLESGSTRYRLRGDVEGVEHSFDLAIGEHRIGSSSAGDLRLPASGVSREHALLCVTAGGLAVEDRGSKNGTFVDGKRVTRSTVPGGAKVGFGPIELALEQVESADMELAFTIDSRVEEGPKRVAPPYPSEETCSAERLPRARPSELVFPEDYLPGTSPPMAALYRQMENLLEGDLPVLLLGETGVGKERLAAMLHDSSDRRGGPLVAINCAAIPADLLEAEFFGIGKRVATGVDPRSGKFQLAEGGTLFLDEIGEMAPGLQAKLLRVLQEKQIQPVGAQPKDVDVRIVAATNADLEQRMERGQFRRDLYYRLAGCVLTVPPLRECREDIPPLIEHFSRRFARQRERRLRGMTLKALRLLSEYSWPGNIRELQHEIRRLVYLSPEGALLDSGKLSPRIAAAGPSELEVPVSASRHSLLLEPRVRELEARLIREALGRSGGRQIDAARLLGISRNGLADKIKRLGIDRRSFRPG